MNKQKKEEKEEISFFATYSLNFYWVICFLPWSADHFLYVLYICILFSLIAFFNAYIQIDFY